MGPVSISVHRIPIVVVSIQPIHVIHHPVLVVIQPISRNFSGILPHVRSQILVSVPNTGVNHRHHERTSAGTHIPTFRRIDIRVRSLVQTP